MAQELMNKLKFAILLCSALSLNVQAEIYKYVDENGRITYSTIPKKGARKLDLEPINLGPIKLGPMDDLQRSYPKQELLSKSKQKDWGVLDSDHQTKEIVFIKKMLKDPYSAKFRFDKPTRGTWSNGESFLAWYSDVYVNAKNGFGGYAGEQRYYFLYQCRPNSPCKFIGYRTPGEA